MAFRPGFRPAEACGSAFVIPRGEEWLSIADGFSQAALGGDWLQALGRLAEACGADRGQLIGIGADKAVPFNWIYGMPPEPLAEFVAMGGGDPARNPRVRHGITAPLLKAWHDLDCLSEAEQRRAPEYCELAIRYDFPFGSQATLMRDSEMLIGMSTLRGASRGLPSPDDRRAFESLVPHVRDAVRLQMTLEGQGAALMAGALEAVGAAAFVCDASGRVRAMTPAAEAALSAGPVRLRDQRLAAARHEDGRALEIAFDGLLRARHSARPRASRTLVLRREEDPLSPVLVDLMSLPAREHALGFQPAVLATLRGVSRQDVAFSQHLRAAFGLTESEADVALRLAEGDSREAIAAGRGASVETVRSQVKSLFAKLGVRRTGELAAKLNRLR